MLHDVEFLRYMHLVLIMYVARLIVYVVIVSTGILHMFRISSLHRVGVVNFNPWPPYPL